MDKSRPIWAYLDQYKRVIECDAETWAERFGRDGDTGHRIVAQTFFGSGDDMVSTVFLGLNSSIGSRPLWFETMTFIANEWGECERYETYEEAVRGHGKKVREVERRLDQVGRSMAELRVDRLTKPKRRFTTE